MKPVLWLAAVAGMITIRPAAAAAVGDLDRDGRLDVFVANLRLADDTQMPPVFGGAPAEVWLNGPPSPATRRAGGEL